jgi:D-citramalate synthase
LPYIISDVLDSDTIEKRVVVENYVLGHARGMKPSTTIKLKVAGVIYEEHAQGDGQFDAFMNALKKIYKIHSKTVLPKLIDYAVRIPPGSHSDALCETIITWKRGEKEFLTRGLDSDQTVSAIKATEKMLNII